MKIELILQSCTPNLENFQSLLRSKIKNTDRFPERDVYQTNHLNATAQFCLFNPKTSDITMKVLAFLAYQNRTWAKKGQSNYPGQVTVPLRQVILYTKCHSVVSATMV